jgi:hypothetical protein
VAALIARDPIASRLALTHPMHQSSETRRQSRSRSPGAAGSEPTGAPASVMKASSPAWSSGRNQTSRQPPAFDAGDPITTERDVSTGSAVRTIRSFLPGREISRVLAGRVFGPSHVDPPPKAPADHVDVRTTPVARTSDTCSGVNAKIDSLSQLSELASIAEVCNGVCAP